MALDIIRNGNCMFVGSFSLFSNGFMKCFNILLGLCCLFCFIIYLFIYFIFRGVVAVIVWQLDLQLPMHSVIITTDSRSGRGVQHYVIKFVSNLRQVGGFLRVLKYRQRNIKETNKHTYYLWIFLLIKILKKLFVVYY